MGSWATRAPRARARQKGFNLEIVFAAAAALVLAADNTPTGQIEDQIR